MLLTEKIANFREPDINDYPELKNLTKPEIYDYFIGCGGLYLAAKMARKMNLNKGDVVLDLGCGFGSASIFMAEKFGVKVVSVDHWFSADKLFSRIKDKDYDITPLNLDITKHIPFAKDYFDAIFCMNSLFLCSENIDFLRELLGTLKKDGTFCVGSEGFNKEPDYIDIPEPYNFDWEWNVWDKCCSKYHTLTWWTELLQKTDMLDIFYSNELEDSTVLWEDIAKNYTIYINNEIQALGAVIEQEKITAQILYGKKSGLYPILYIIAGKKK